MTFICKRPFVHKVILIALRIINSQSNKNIKTTFTFLLKNVMLTQSIN